MTYFKTVLASALLFPYSAFAADEYACERTYFSNSALVSNEFATALMPAELFIRLDYDKKVALTSATGSEYPLTMKSNKASYRLKKSRMTNHRFVLNYKKLASSGEITWGSAHSDDNYKNAAPARYKCKKL